MNDLKNDSVHTDIKSNRLFAKDLAACAMKHRPRTKYCGIGDNLVFFDTDGEKYPCSFVTPMTFSPEDIRILSKIDFSNDEAFIDEECFNQCYIYPICNTCAGANFLIHKELKKRDKRKCKIRKLVALFVADLQSKLIIKNPQLYEPTKLYYTIEAIKEIKKLYLKEFEIVS